MIIHPLKQVRNGGSVLRVAIKVDRLGDVVDNVVHTRLISG